MKAWSNWVLNIAWFVIKHLKFARLYKRGLLRPDLNIVGFALHVSSSQLLSIEFVMNKMLQQISTDEALSQVFLSSRNSFEIPSIPIRNIFFTTRYNDVNCVVSTNMQKTVMTANCFLKIWFRKYSLHTKITTKNIFYWRNLTNIIWWS